MRPIYYDTETTGISPQRDRVIELAAYDPVLDRTFVELINPGMPIPKEATSIHNISDAMVANAPSFGEVGARFEEFCSGDTVLIAHNNDAFDVLFMKQEFARANLTFPQWKFIDSLKWARKYRPDLPRHSLQFLREVYDIAANNAHRALDDVKVLHQMFSYMIDDLPLETVFLLLNQAQAPKEILTMPFGKHVGLPLSQVPPNYVSWLKSSGAFDKPENTPLKEAFEKVMLAAEKSAK